MVYYALNPSMMRIRLKAPYTLTEDNRSDHTSRVVHPLCLGQQCQAVEADHGMGLPKRARCLQSPQPKGIGGPCQ